MNVDVVFQKKLKLAVKWTVYEKYAMAKRFLNVVDMHDENVKCIIFTKIKIPQITIDLKNLKDDILVPIFIFQFIFNIFLCFYNIVIKSIIRNRYQTR